jgi:uncharacterized protein (TIGR03435 family)
MLLLVATALSARPQVRLEVTSIRPSQAGATAKDLRWEFSGDRFGVKAATVGDLLDALNGFQLLRVVGGPDWMRTDRYDIEAKVDRPLEFGDREEAITALLEERFQLKSHRETREVSAFVLRASRTLGIKQSGGDEKYSMHVDRGDFVYTHASMSILVNRLTQMLHVPVVDETELKGFFDFEMPISQVQLQPSMSWEDRVRDAVEATGLRLENRRIPLEVTVVDRCERPTAN